MVAVVMVVLVQQEEQQWQNQHHVRVKNALPTAISDYEWESLVAVVSIKPQGHS